MAGPDHLPPPHTLVTGAAAQAVREGLLPGEVYTDGEVWADTAALDRWARHSGQAAEQPP